MKLSNEQYNTAKFILLNVVPALVTLIAGLGVLYGFMQLRSLRQSVSLRPSQVLYL